MKENNEKLKLRVKELCGDTRFIHHKWFYKYHLEIIKRLVDELTKIYQETDCELLEALVWSHDLEKITKNLEEVKPDDVLKEAGYSNEEIEKINKNIEIMDKHKELDMNEQSIEVKIISSTDAAAHMIGPFYPIFWYEHPEREIEELMKGDLEKLRRDWERKIVLPEVKRAFEDRYKLLLEQRGVYSERFL